MTDHTVCLPLSGRFHEQRGQALAESLVAISFVLVPFVIAVPLLAKYQDIRQANVSAARTAAFECSVNVETCGQQATTDVIADQIRRRHFSQAHLALRSDETPADGQIGTEHNRFWVDRQGRPLLDSYRNVSLQITRENFQAISNPKNQWINRLIEGASDLAGPGRFGLGLKHGLFTASVQTRVPMDGWWRDVLSAGQNGNDPLVFSDRLVLLSDAWNASSAKGNETRSFLSRVNRGRRLPGAAETLRAANQAVPLLPAGTIDRLPQDDPEKALELVHGALITTMKREGRAEPVPFVRNQAKENFHYHRIDVDIVPPARLEGGPNPPSRRAEGPSRNHRIANQP